MTIFDLSCEFNINYIIPRLKPSTARGYLTNLNKYILPTVGDIELTDISVKTIDIMVSEIPKTLSNKTIVYIHATFRKMLNYALKRGYIYNNPYKNYDLPRVASYKYRTLNQKQISDILKKSKFTSLEVPIILALCYGLRRGEILGIILDEDMDYENLTLHIQRTRSVEKGQSTVTSCKTKQSNRYILFSKEHMDIIRFDCINYSDYLVSLSPAQLDKRFKNFLSINDLPDIRFHDLRHSYATYMLSKGVNPKIVSSVLGHSGVDVTLDIYSHPDVSMQKACVEAFNKL